MLSRVSYPPPRPDGPPSGVSGVLFLLRTGVSAPTGAMAFPPQSSAPPASTKTTGPPPPCRGALCYLPATANSPRSKQRTFGLQRRPGHLSKCWFPRKRRCPGRDLERRDPTLGRRFTSTFMTRAGCLPRAPQIQPFWPFPPF